MPIPDEVAGLPLSDMILRAIAEPAAFVRRDRYRGGRMEPINVWRARAVWEAMGECGLDAPTIDLRDHAAAQRLRYDRYDHVLVERIIAGEHRGPIGVIDAAEVIRRMARRGYSDGQIAYRLGCPTRSRKDNAV